MTALLIVASALYGTAIGSFLNVVIYRVPAQKSIVRPPSACPSCGNPISARDNIPVFSWLILRGKCRHCANPIAIRYPLVELLTGALWVGVALRFGWSWTLPAEFVFVSGLIALAFIDLDQMKLPRVIVWPLGVAVLLLLVMAAAIHGTWHRLLLAVICGAVEFAFLFLINWISPKALGFGDVRLSPVLGLALGWLGWRYAFLGFFAANFVGAVVGIILMVAQKAGLRTRVPFGVFLAIGAYGMMMYAGQLKYPA